MNRKPFLIAGAALIAVASTAVVATAHDGANGPRKGKFNAEMLFEQFDLDGDGALTRDEIAMGAGARFNETDTNGDGLVSAEELAAEVEKRSAERIAKRIERNDADGDGMLSLDEMQARFPAERLDRLFERADADQDGALTMAEIEDVRGKFGPRRWWKNGGGESDN